MIPATLCFIFNDDPPHSILLGRKKRGFAIGKMGGFGGKIHEGESPVQAASRELYEEAGITTDPSDLVPLGILTFIFPNMHAWDQEVHVFVAQKWHGLPQESEEMRPGWFPLNNIPFDQMWDDMHYWLPHILKGERISAVFTFDQDNETVKDYTIQLL